MRRAGLFQPFSRMFSGLWSDSSPVSLSRSSMTTLARHRVAAPARIPESASRRIIPAAEIQLQQFLQRLVTFSPEITQMKEFAGSLHNK